MSLPDRDAYDALISRLAASGSFAAVVLDDATRQALGSLPTPLAVVSPGPWSVAITDDDALGVRRARFDVTIVLRGDDPRSRFREADRLCRQVLEAINGAAFGPGCIPLLSKVERGECRLSSGDGEARCTLHGTFSHLAPCSSPNALSIG